MRTLLGWMLCVVVGCGSSEATPSSDPSMETTHATTATATTASTTPETPVAEAVFVPKR